MIKIPVPRRATSARLAIAGAVLALGIQAAAGGAPRTLAAQPLAVAAATMAPMSSALPKTTCPAILPPKPRPYPGVGNPDAGAPLGDYGDAPDGSFPFPAYSLSGNFPTLWHHGGAYTRVVNQEWLGPRVSTERGATDPLDPDGHPNLLFLGSTPLAADLDCRDDSNPSLDLAAKTFQATVTVAPGAPHVRRVLNVVADLNVSGKWNAPKEWVVRNCVFLVPSPFSGRIQCPLVGSSTLSPLFTQGTVAKPGRIICPPKVWYRILLDRDPIVAGTIPGPWAGWDGHGPKAGFGYGEVEDYLCPCDTHTDPTPTPTIGKPTYTPTATATATPTCTPNTGVPCGTRTNTPSPTPTCTFNGTAAPCGTATNTPTATPTCTPSTAGVPCTKVPTFDITVKHDYGAANGIAVFCPVINLSYAPAALTNDLEWVGAPWIGATTGALPAGWTWDPTFVGGIRAFTTNTPPWSSTGGSTCFTLQVPPNTVLPSPVVIDATHNGVVIGHINA